MGTIHRNRPFTEVCRRLMLCLVAATWVTVEVASVPFSMGSHQQADDRILVELASLAKDGDACATQRLFEILVPRVRNLVRYVIRGDRDVDDLAQEALVTLFRGLGSYRGDGPFRAWADRVVVRSAFRAVKQRRLDEAPLCETDSEAYLEHEPAAVDSYVWTRTLARCLDQLPWEQRQTVVLHFVLEYTVPDVAAEMDVGVETVRSRLRIGMRKLRASMGAGLERQVG